MVNDEKLRFALRDDISTSRTRIGINREAFERGKFRASNDLRSSSGNQYFPSCSDSKVSLILIRLVGTVSKINRFKTKLFVAVSARFFSRVYVNA